MVSNVALPSVKIGSWSNRITCLLQNSNCFDLVLSPTNSPTDIFRFCKKRKPIPILRKLFPNWHLVNWLGRDYLVKLRLLEKKTKVIDVVVMDDLLLLELMVHFKRSSKAKVSVIFSFHGHLLHLSPSFGVHVDKVLFLTKKGYEESLKWNEIFTPEVVVVGNGVNSSQFFPVSEARKNVLKGNLGISSQDEIVIWMANERPKKGLHLFLRIAEKLMSVYPNIQFLILGNNRPLPHQSDRIKGLGQIPNNKLSTYLQAADYYFFTTLWKEGFGLSMVEAAKCGCSIIASDIGGIAEVNETFLQSHLVSCPNMVDEWVSAFEKARAARVDYIPLEHIEYLESFHSYQNWEENYLAALNN